MARCLVVLLVVVLFGCTGGETMTVDEAEQALEELGRDLDDYFGRPVPCEGDSLADAQFAFSGMVLAVSERFNQTRDSGTEEIGIDLPDELLAELEWPWVTFAVQGWYTRDWGSEFAVWMPQAEVAVGETWLVAGDAHGALQDDYSGQSGTANGCIATVSSTARAGEWDTYFGGTVIPDSGSPEMTPSSDMVARIDAAQKQWDEAAITDYTVVMAIGDGTPPVGECVESRLTRIVVQDGTPVQAVKLQQACAVQLDLVATPDDVFDAARAFSGIPSFRINFDPDTGFPTSFSGSDRSVVISQFVVDFELSTEVAVIGWPAVEEALADGRALWADAALDRYEFDLEHIAMVRPPAVTIQVSGDTHTVTSDTGDTAARESQSILGIFDLVDAHPRTNPVVAVFDPDFGYVRDIWLDQSFADGEQEFHIRLTPG